MLNFIYSNEAIIRLFAFVGGFGLIALWEQLTPFRNLNRMKLRRWLNNFAMLVVGTVLVRVALPIAAVGTAYLAEQHHWGIASQVELSFWLKVIISLILLDLSIYVQHVGFHVLPLLWRFHRVHHSDQDCDVSTGLRFHPIEILISLVLKISVITLLGAPVLAVIVFEIVLNVMSMFTHSNVRINASIDKVLRWLLVTPYMHLIHHSNLENETNSNFGFNLSCWDRLFGTYLDSPRDGFQNIKIGIDTFRENEWQNIKGMLLIPFAHNVEGYAINKRDTLNVDKFDNVQKIIADQTRSLQEAKDIAERKSIELCGTVLRLTESESFQRMLVENMVDGFITANPSGYILSFNPSAEKIFGYRADEVIGKNISLLMPENEAKHHDAYLERYQKVGSTRIMGIDREIMGRKKDGSCFPIDIALNETLIGEKKIFSAVIRDISEKVEAQRLLMEQNETLDNILENTDDAYLTVRQDWTITFANSACRSLLDVEPSEIMGEDLREILPDVVSMFYKMMRQTITTQQPQEVTRLYGPTMKNLEAHCRPTKEGLIVYFRDITLRVKSEDELRVVRESEFRNREKVKLAAELSSYLKAIDQYALVSATDPSGKIIKVNEKFCQVSGYSRDELLGQDHRIVNSGTHPKEFFNDLWQTIASGNIWRGEICNRAKDGSLYWVESTIVPLTNSNGTIERYISVRVDVTERKYNEAKLEKAYQDLSMANFQLEELSRTDSLTNLANRRHFDETIKSELTKLGRQSLPLTLILCDIDYFKRYNDSYGHPAGDECLKKVAHALNSSFTRSGDLVARYGGEEFAIVLLNVNKENALLLAERMRKTVINLNLCHNASDVSDVVTLSIGVTTLVPDSKITVAEIIDQADKALYSAKQKGRNNVQFYH